MINRSIAALFAGLIASLPAASQEAAVPPGHVERNDPAIDALIPPDAKIEVIGSGFAWSEGPAWRRQGGYLLFSDIPNNTIYRWKEGEGLSVFLRPSGYTEDDPFGLELGSNALTFDLQGRLVIDDQGNRRVVRLNEKGFTKTVLADRYDGKRLNSPNDLVYRSNGDLYFTDPPYGLTGLNSNPHKELKLNGVFRLDTRGRLTLIIPDLTFPNGLAFSPDEKTLYIQVSDPKNAVWMAYDVLADGTVAKGRVFFDANALVRAGKQGLPDGMKVDQKGNIFGGGPGGVLVLSPDGRHLGTIVTGQVTSNCAFGDDGSTLYMTANHYVMRIRLRTKGVGF
ncbi:MAG TPA: SMP-30/gluconolactonase/LRE family protein [Opitutaceae bacterium]|nr:SMP-30/gluconolactonase/LRE family protein [Opitutaceae bacterium]